MDDDVIQREPFIRTLKGGAIDRRAWESTRLAARKHRKKVIGTNLALEPGASGTGRGWARPAQLFLFKSISPLLYTSILVESSRFIRMPTF